MKVESDYFENPIQVDKGRLSKSEQGPIDIAAPWRRPCLYAAEAGASKGPPACNLTHDRIWAYPPTCLQTHSSIRSLSNDQLARPTHSTELSPLQLLTPQITHPIQSSTR